jgi:hypothetical protein
MIDDARRELAVFTQAIKVPIQGRSKFLDIACCGDENLRQEVEALLTAHDRIDNFLEEPAKVQIPDCDQRRAQILTGIEQRNGQQPGDPSKLAEAIVRLGNEPKPPTRFLAGAIAVNTAAEKLSSMRAELDAWRQLSLSTDGNYAMQTLTLFWPRSSEASLAPSSLLKSAKFVSLLSACFGIFLRLHSVFMLSVYFRKNKHLLPPRVGRF